MSEQKFDEEMRELRTRIKEIGVKVWAIRKAGMEESLPESADHPEMSANLILAYRHLEDAGMRLGKAIQAYDGGKSVYDK